MQLPKYSMGIGDRFAHQGEAQLSAIMKAQEAGIQVAPIWNKSHREHTTIKTRPEDTRKAADAAVKTLNYTGPYFVDADHVGLKTVDLFISSSNFFTLDVADFIGETADSEAINDFIEKYKKYVGSLSIPGIDEKFEITEQSIRTSAEKFLYAIQEAKRIYEHILEQKGEGNFITEVSMDETDAPQTPIEMFFILAAIADAGIPAQTIAPKFTGRFNKGVDYVGDVAQFTKEFEQDIAVIAFAIKEFGLPENLKLSVHSGSDKFSIYRPIHDAITKFNTGLHLKTAGTTWLEELIGLAMAGGEGLEIAKKVYRASFNRFDELAKPYATVIDIDQAKLPAPDEVDGWDGKKYADTLRHDQSNSLYNIHFRQLLHVGYKVAAELGDEYLSALKKYKNVIAEHVAENIFDRHLKRIFLD